MSLTSSPSSGVGSIRLPVGGPPVARIPSGGSSMPSRLSAPARVTVLTANDVKTRPLMAPPGATMTQPASSLGTVGYPSSSAGSLMAPLGATMAQPASPAAPSPRMMPAHQMQQPSFMKATADATSVAQARLQQSAAAFFRSPLKVESPMPSSRTRDIRSPMPSSQTRGMQSPMPSSKTRDMQTTQVGLPSPPAPVEQVVQVVPTVVPDDVSLAAPVGSNSVAARLAQEDVSLAAPVASNPTTSGVVQEDEPFSDDEEPVEAAFGFRRQPSDLTAFDFAKARLQDSENVAQHEVFEWLKWGPALGSPCYTALHKHFPGAIPGEVVHARTSQLLATERYSFTEHNTIFGTSICPDEINSVKGTMVDIMKNHWGGMAFPMGGISGAPFSGKTGFVAFSHHVPKDGNVFVLFGPHVSISAEGEVGKCYRRGMATKSTACGAVVGAYNACTSGNVDASEFDKSDMQMSWIKSQVAPYAEQIKKAENPMAHLAHQAYEFVKDLVLEVVNNDFGPGQLCLLGGIMINMPEGYSDHFLPLMFQINKKDQVPENLMNVFRNRVISEGFKTEGESQRRINLYAKMLSKVALFSNESHYNRLQIARSMTQLTFYCGEYIVNDGGQGNVLYVILIGEAVAKMNGRQQAKYSGCLREVSNQAIIEFLDKSTDNVHAFGEIGGSNNVGNIEVLSSKAVVLAISKDVSDMTLKNTNASAKAVTDYQADLQVLRTKDYKQATHHYVFSWLHWSPQPETMCYRALHDQFPCAIPGPALFARILEALKQFGMTPTNTIFGTSLCPDEINGRNGELVQQLKMYWGENFPLGGISGAPFAGKTGFTAFSHHVPDDGNVIVLFGPHVGISAEGEVGKFHRTGQDKPSTACGAAVGAYNACVNSGSIDPEFDKADMQMDWFKQRIAPHAHRIQEEENPMGALAHQAYKIVEDEVDTVVSTKFGDGWLVLMGVVQINMPKPYFDHFLPLKFEVRNKIGESHDLLQWVVAPDGTTSTSESQGFTNFNFEDARAKDAENRAQHEVFGWLNWSPIPQSPCYKALHKFFPGAIPGEVVHARTRAWLEDPKFRFSAKNTIFGTSICPDEINSVEGTMIDTMKNHWGGMSFPMGGISGAPFSGKTGFVAFSHHVPIDGNVFVVFGPHVSISEQGEISKCFRRGIEKISTACGAVVGAYNACMGEEIEGPDFDMSDMQMSWIKSRIAPYVDQIKECENPMAVLAHQAYEFVKEMVLQVVNHKFGKGQLALLGGIMINMPEGMSDHFLPLHFRISKQNSIPQDLMRAFKNRLSSPHSDDPLSAPQMKIDLYATMLAKVEVFKTVTPAQRFDVARSMTQLTFYKGEYIIKQGEEEDLMYVFLIGEAVCQVNGKEVSRYHGCLRDFSDQSIKKLLQQSGSISAFGENGFKGSKRKASIVISSSKAVVLAISREVFNAILKSESITPRSVTAFDKAMQTLRTEDYRHAMHHYVFSWLQWSPQPNTICYHVLHDQFPTAIPGPALFSRSLEALKELGCTPDNTIFGTSLCPDEINTRNGELVDQLKQHWGELFPLGGISGAPFAGKTGFAAFSHHVPDDGNVIVLFGPHVGITADGEVGKFLRKGQDNSSTACGAAVGAYNACIANGSVNPEFDKADMQMAWFKEQIAPHAQRIQQEQNPMAALAHQSYELVKEEVKKVVSNGFGEGWLVLLGVIQINMPNPYFDHFLPLMFEVRNKRETYDLMAKLATPEQGDYPLSPKMDKAPAWPEFGSAMGA